MLDLAIIGSGPAAFSAAIYVARAGYNVKIFEKNKIGGTLTEIAKIENYPGYIGSGQGLAKQLQSQAESAGAVVEYGELTSLQPIDNHIELTIDDEKFEARSVLIATGSEPRRLDFSIDKPVSYCALCDAPLYKDKSIAVVGGGNSAFQESLYLASIAKNVTLFSHTAAKAEPYIINKAQACPNIDVRMNTTIDAEVLKPFDAIFVFIGAKPATDFLDRALLSDDGTIKTANYMSKLKGVFAAGDVRDGSTKQAIMASADGVAAAMEIIKYLKG